MTDQQFKVYLGANGDFLRTATGAVRYFSDHEEAKRVAEERGGFVLPASAPSPGGFDRTWAG